MVGSFELEEHCKDREVETACCRLRFSPRRRVFRQEVSRLGPDHACCAICGRKNSVLQGQNTRCGGTNWTFFSLGGQSKGLDGSFGAKNVQLAPSLLLRTVPQGNLLVSFLRTRATSATVVMQPCPTRASLIGRALCLAFE